MKRYTRADVFTGFRLHMALKTHDLDPIFPVRPFFDALGMVPPDGGGGERTPQGCDCLILHHAG
jgi:hypothetical protein